MCTNERARLEIYIQKLISEGATMQYQQLPHVYADAYDCKKVSRYEVVRRLGEGAFGQVHLAIDRELGEYCALKSVRCGVNGSYDDDDEQGLSASLPKPLFREIQAMQQLSHPNLMPLLDVYPRGSDVILVMKYMMSDLAEILEQSPTPVPESQVKGWMQQVFRGLAFMHSKGLLHRDLKPSNLLIDSRGVLKIGDFGLARVHAEPQKGSYSHQVATRWYRAPELLYGSRRYGFGVDLWAAGCILAELLLHAPMFPGHSDIDQLMKVMKIMGTPTPESWPGLRDLPDYDKVSFIPMEPRAFADICCGCSPASLALLNAVLVLDPKQRLSAELSLRHEWFYSRPEPASPGELRIWERQSAASKRQKDGRFEDYLQGGVEVLDKFELLLTPDEEVARINASSVSFGSETLNVT